MTIRESISQVNWVTQVRGSFLNAYLSFLKVLETAMDSCIPRYKNVKSKKNIYMTTKAIRKKDLKNRLWRRYKGSGCDYDRSRYTKVKNELRSLTRKLRMQFEKGIAENIKVSPKKCWSYVKTKTRSKIPILMKMVQKQ